MATRTKKSAAEKMAEDLRAMRAEEATPEARAAEIRDRELIEAEFPPSRPGPEWSEAIATLRLARERSRMNLDVMAEKSGVDRMAISRIESGQGNPTLGTLGRMAAALDLRPILGFVTVETSRDST